MAKVREGGIRWKDRRRNIGRGNSHGKSLEKVRNYCGIQYP
jgi:hypothetical protein